MDEEFHPWSQVKTGRSSPCIFLKKKGSRLGIQCRSGPSKLLKWIESLMLSSKVLSKKEARTRTQASKQARSASSSICCWECVTHYHPTPSPHHPTPPKKNDQGRRLRLGCLRATFVHPPWVPWDDRYDIHGWIMEDSSDFEQTRFQQRTRIQQLRFNNQNDFHGSTCWCKFPYVIWEFRFFKELLV